MTGRQYNRSEIVCGHLQLIENSASIKGSVPDLGLLLFRNKKFTC